MILPRMRDIAHHSGTVSGVPGHVVTLAVPHVVWTCRVTNNLSLCFNGHFPGEPGLASVYWSKGWRRWWWQLNYRSYKLCKAPVILSPPTNQHPVFLQAGCPSCRPTNSFKALKGKYHILWTCLPQAHLGVFQLCLWPLIAPGYLGGGLPCLSSALWCQYPKSDKQCTQILHFIYCGRLTV